MEAPELHAILLPSWIPLLNAACAPRKPPRKTQRHLRSMMLSKFLLRDLGQVDVLCLRGVQTPKGRCVYRSPMSIHDAELQGAQSIAA